MNSMLYPALQQQFIQFEKEFAAIEPHRKLILEELAAYVMQKKQASLPVQLNFICTHNSRRSHISQIWAQAAAAYYGIENIHCYSGGTEATAFNPRAVKAMTEAGFNIARESEQENPHYVVSFGDHQPSLTAFSKVYSDAANPPHSFAAIMTCSHADENCPVVIGAEKRISLPFNDPKEFDGTRVEAEKYTERVQEIGREIAYAFSKVKK